MLKTIPPILLTLAFLTAPHMALAGSNDQAKIAGHLQVPITGKGAPGICEQAQLPPCNPGESHLLVQGETGSGYYLYLLVLDGDAESGVAGASFGISYGEDLLVNNWVRCADLEFDGGPPGVSWPDSGSGNVITWSSCQNTPAQGDSSGGVTAVLGAFYVYAYAEESFSVTRRTYVPTPDLDVADCSGAASHLPYPDAVGTVTFGNLPGSDPCLEEEESFPAQRNWLPEIIFVKLRTTTASKFMETARDLRATYGLRILLGIGPDGLLCQSSPGVTSGATELAKDERVELVTRDAVPISDASEREVTEPAVGSVEIWNYIKTVAPAVSWKAGHEPRMPATCLPARGPKAGELGGSEEGALSLEQNKDRQTSVYMLGDIGLKVVLPESQASGSCPTEDWTSGQITQILGEIAEALLFYSSYPVGSFVSFFMPEPYSMTSTTTEPITENHDEHQWRREAMQQLGFSSGDHTEREFAFCNSKRRAFRTDWYYLAYVVNSYCDTDGRFADSLFAFVDDLHRPAVIMTYDNDSWQIGLMDMVMRHETSHVFGAADEYNPDICECGTLFGYLHVGNGNCISCTANQDPCIMANASLQFSDLMCAFTLGQIGWRDTDGDGPFDPIDHPDSGRNLLVGDLCFPVSPGDMIDIYTVSLDWVKRVVASDLAEDGGGVVWDGMNYAGYPAEALPTPYVWQRNNGGPTCTTPLYMDGASPVLSNVILNLGPYFNSLHTLTFDFEDSDTFSGRIRATATLGGSPSASAVIFADEFRIGTQGSFPPISRQFTLPAPGVYALDLLVWDVGGGHNATYSQEFSVGSQIGISDDTGSALNIALRPMPNPSRGAVRWAVSGLQTVEGVVLDVQGRLVKRLPQQRVEGEGYLEWDGRDESGMRASPGQYYVKASDGQGHILRGKVVILR